LPHAFAGSILEMIAVAEESGKLDQELVRIANVTEGDLDRQLKAAVALAEPLMLFFIAGFIGTIFIGMVIPISPCKITSNKTPSRSRHESSLATTVCPRNFRAGRSRHQGFTLIELLLVLVILGILAAIVVPKFAGRTEQARQTAAQSQIATFGTALDAFEVRQWLLSQRQERPARSCAATAGRPKLEGTLYEGGHPNDPWGRPYVYECPGKHNPSSYDLMSMGPDGRIGGDDDLANWTQKR
jgi:type II secretion system protein G